MATFDIFDHPLLSDDAKALDGDRLEAETEVAEQTLGVSGFTPATETDDTTIRHALALQINFQVAGGTSAALFSSESRGGRSNTYRGRVAHPTAKTMVDRITGGGWPTERTAGR